MLDTTISYLLSLSGDHAGHAALLVISPVQQTETKFNRVLPGLAELKSLRPTTMFGIWYNVSAQPL